MNALLARHLEWCAQRNLRPSYIASRRRTIDQLRRELGVDPEVATEDQLHDWYDALSRRISPEARAVVLSHCTNFYRWLVRERYRDDDPTIRLARPRIKRHYPRPIAEQKLARALAGAPGRVRPWLYLAAFAGLRACEIAPLRAEDLRRDLVPPVVLVADGKGGKPRIIPLHPTVVEVLDECALPNRGYLFRHWSRPGPPNPWNVSHGCNAYLHSIGITSTLHTLRHFFGSQVFRLSKDLRLTQELMGHADPATTAGYAAWDAEGSDGVVRRLRAEIDPNEVLDDGEPEDGAA